MVTYHNNQKIFIKNIEEKLKIFHCLMAVSIIIIKNLNYKINKDEIILTTLPTPKQEQLAEYLTKKNKHYKIICIGGSINIVSGLEKKFLSSYIILNLFGDLDMKLLEG